MSGDHNMNQTSPGWRKRQIALEKMADNARELGLDYEPSIIEMARKAGFVEDVPECAASVWVQDTEITEIIERFAELVRADERNSWPAEMEAMERQVNILTDALAQEREAIIEIVAIHGGSVEIEAAIRARVKT